MGPQCSWNMAMLLPPPRHKPKTQQGISKHLGLSQSNQSDASPQDTTSPASILEGSLLPAVSNFVQMAKLAQNSPQPPQVRIPRVRFLSPCGLAIRKWRHNPTQSSLDPPGSVAACVQDGCHQSLFPYRFSPLPH